MPDEQDRIPVIEHANVYEAMAAAISDVEAVQKSGKIAAGNFSYSFASDADILGAVKPVLARHGLFVYPAHYEIAESFEAQTIDYKTGELTGRVMRYVRVRGTWAISHASGTEIHVDAFGEGSDQGDKAITKAMTSCQKYALRQAFTIAIDDGSDPDHYASKASGRKGQQQQQQRAPQQQRPQNGGGGQKRPAPAGDWPDWFVSDVQPALDEMGMEPQVFAPMFPRGMEITPQNVAGYANRIRAEDRDLGVEMLAFLRGEAVT